MNTMQNILPGIAAAIEEIARRNQFDRAESRLAEKMRPARLAPLNLSHRNGMAASDAVINEILGKLS
jgi:hypothetical protein